MDGCRKGVEVFDALLWIRGNGAVLVWLHSGDFPEGDVLYMEPS